MSDSGTLASPTVHPHTWRDNVFSRPSLSGKVSVSKHFEFEAAHFLPNYVGKCHNLHGHTYKLEVTVAGMPNRKEGDPLEGIVIDFGDLSAYVKSEIVDYLDHQILNERVGFIPTAENLALAVQSILIPWCSANQLTLEEVKLWETTNSWCTVRK